MKIRFEMGEACLKSVFKTAHLEVGVFSKRINAQNTLRCKDGTDEVVFYLDAAWLNEGRCPGGRPSVSKTKDKLAISLRK